MSIYIALLRGINVGGKNIIKMADLKRVFQDMGLGAVQTYIQSGNVLFVSEEAEEILQQKIEYAIEQQFGFSTAVILRTATELEKIICNCPFTAEEIAKAESSSEGECLYVSLLRAVPSDDKLEYMEKYKNAEEAYQVKDRDIYLLFYRSIRNSKLANSMQKLDVPSTVRNWKTINKLFFLAKDIEAKIKVL